MNFLEVKSISQLHKILGLKPPEHPLISIFNWEDVQHQEVSAKVQGLQTVLDFYSVSEKDTPCETLTYGRNTYDFNEGSMMFVGPGQVMSSSSDAEVAGTEVI